MRLPIDIFLESIGGLLRQKGNLRLFSAFGIADDNFSFLDILFVWVSRLRRLSCRFWPWVQAWVDSSGFGFWKRSHRLCPFPGGNWKNVWCIEKFSCRESISIECSRIKLDIKNILSLKKFEAYINSMGAIILGKCILSTFRRSSAAFLLGRNTKSARTKSL